MWLISTYLGIAADYLIAAALIAGGVYLAAFFDLAATNPLAWLIRPLRFIGYALVGAGIMLSSYTYGKQTGAAVVTAEWKAKNYEMKIASLNRDIAAAKAATEAKDAEAKALEDQKRQSDDQLQDYAKYAAGLSASLSACRSASGDDDKRVCDIIGNAAPGCQSSH